MKVALWSGVLLLMLAGMLLLLPLQAVPEEEAGQCKRLVFDQLESLNQTLSADEFRVFYATEGTNALPNITDVNNNGTPDVIDDLIMQLTTARDVYSGVLDLKHPLQQPRYRLAQTINVFVIKLDDGNGLAFDEVVDEKTHKDRPGLGCGIKIFLSNNLQPSKNITPAHELFHLYQYAYTMFKTGWYLEGMTHWAETAITDEVIGSQGNPANEPDKQKVFHQSYEAAAYWQDRARRYDASAQLIMPQYLYLRTYTNGRPVIKDEFFVGAGFIKAALESLEQLDKKIETEKGLKRYNWPESTQHSHEFDQLIWDAVDTLGKR